MDGVRRFFARPRTLLGFAWASLIGNSVLIVTGAAVRLTQSGLGCPTWPRCTDASYVPTPAMGVHGIIEFGNRLLTFVLIAIAIGTVLAVWLQVPRRTAQDPKLKLLALIMALGIPFQGVIGGLTVLSGLNPFVVALHLLLSVLLVCLAVVLIRRVRNVPPTPVEPRVNLVAKVTFVVAWLAVWLGTVVTGSGPHSGDSGAARTGFNIEHTAKIHAWTVWLLVALTIWLVLKLRTRAVALLLAAELVQGVIGYVQYFTGVPVPLVLLHMLGITIVMAAATNLAASVTATASQRVVTDEAALRA